MNMQRMCSHGRWSPLGESSPRVLPPPFPPSLHGTPLAPTIQGLPSFSVKKPRVEILLIVLNPPPPPAKLNIWSLVKLNVVFFFSF